jgi:hypothetical protein
MAYSVVTAEYKVTVIIPQDTSLDYYYIFPKVTQNFFGYRFKDDRNVGTIATRWLLTQVTNAYRSKHRITSGEMLHASAWPIQRIMAVL